MSRFPSMNKLIFAVLCLSSGLWSNSALAQQASQVSTSSGNYPGYRKEPHTERKSSMYKQLPLNFGDCPAACDVDHLCAGFITDNAAGTGCWLLADIGQKISNPEQDTFVKMTRSSSPAKSDVPAKPASKPPSSLLTSQSKVFYSKEKNSNRPAVNSAYFDVSLDTCGKMCNQMGIHCFGFTFDSGRGSGCYVKGMLGASVSTPGMDTYIKLARKSGSF